MTVVAITIIIIVVYLVSSIITNKKHTYHTVYRLADSPIYVDLSREFGKIDKDSAYFILKFSKDSLSLAKGVDSALSFVKIIQLQASTRPICRDFFSLNTNSPDTIFLSQSIRIHHYISRDPPVCLFPQKVYSGDLETEWPYVSFYIDDSGPYVKLKATKQSVIISKVFSYTL